MIVLLHGDDTEASRSALVELKKQFADADVRFLNGKTVDEGLLTTALESSSLFAKDALVVIENFLTSLGKKTKRLDFFAAALNHVPQTSTVILWEQKEIGVATVKRLGQNVDARLFKIPPVIFTFLDELRPSNAKQLLMLLNQVREHTAAEIIFALLVRRLRQLLQLSGGIVPQGLQGWQAGRLTKRARFFTMEQLMAMEHQLLSAEYSVKTGTSPLTLTQHMEQAIIHLV